MQYCRHCDGEQHSHLTMSTGGVFSMGPHTLSVSVSDLFVANRRKVVAALVSSRSLSMTSVMFLQGGVSTTRYDSDHEPLFRQESYFWWLCGVKEPGCALSIRFDANAKQDTPTTTTTLYVPRLDADYATVMGRIRTLQEWKDMYLVDEAKYTDEIEESLLNDLESNSINSMWEKKGAVSETSKLLLLQGRNSDSGSLYEPPASIYRSAQLQRYVDCDTLFPILAECRVCKSRAELHLLQYVTEITSFAHAYVMRNFVHRAPAPSASSHDGDRGGLWEYQAESLFRHYCYYNYGARYMGYTPICGCGPDAAILHYGHAGEPNARQSQTTDICLFDMGAEYFGYGSDVTCSFPVAGTFSDRQGMVYQAVLDAQVAVYAMMRPGVSWVDCHKTAERTLLSALIQAGLVVLPANGTTTIEDLVHMRLGAVFMPHGLGHFIGIDTHDVGGYLPGHPERSSLPGLAKLRMSRILKANMVLTVEPGCYFIDHLLDASLTEDSPLRPYLNASALSAFRGFGGVRLEDVVQVTDTGIVNYTLCPRTIAEVESVLAGEKWPPVTDAAPELHRMRLTATTPLPSPPSW
jgi:Xaa-Pro dipeptidase